MIKGKKMKTLISKYLDIMSTQEDIISELRKENATLKNKNANLKRHNTIYRDNCKQWKNQSEMHRKALIQHIKGLCNAYSNN